MGPAKITCQGNNQQEIEKWSSMEKCYLCLQFYIFIIPINVCHLLKDLVVYL